jgi:hypothetical protein
MNQRRGLTDVFPGVKQVDSSFSWREKGKRKGLSNFWIVPKKRYSYFPTLALSKSGAVEVHNFLSARLRAPVYVIMSLV